MEEHPRGIIVRNAATVERADRVRTSELRTERRANAEREIEAGLLSPPVSLSPAISETVNLTPRSDICAHHGDGRRKVRPIDDLRASGVNAITDMRDTAVPDSLDRILELAVYLRLLSPGCALQAASTDFWRAYRTIGIPVNRRIFLPPH